MTFLVLHLLGYASSLLTLAATTRKAVARRRRRSKRAMLARITRLEHELGLGVYWAKDSFDTFAPVISRPKYPGSSNLFTYAFRCYGCGESVVYADHHHSSLIKVRDKRHLLCNSCFEEVAA